MPETSSFLLLCLGVGLCKALLTLGATPSARGGPFQPTWAERLSYPFLAWTLFLLLLWPGSLSRPLVLGSLQVTVGLGTLALAFLFMDRARLLEGFLQLQPDPWLPPRGILPLGVGWGLREEFLSALLVGTCGAGLASALDGPNVPVSVYHNLIKNVNANLKTLWRYLELRKKIMGLPELRYSDLYASIVKKVDARYTPEQAKELVLNALEPLGDDYVEVLRAGYDHRWVDWYPSPGKRSGAYSNGSAYDVHPYILLNFTGTYEEVSTLAHESGHSMHSYYSNKNQPFATCDYTIFVAEVASTCNENLLMDYMLKHTDDDAMKLFLLGSHIDNLRQTLFRQTQFAEFELKVHEMAEKGEPLTGDALNAVYAEILRKYYGEDEGICTIDPVCYAEWAYIPHFYYNFYVFTYATGLTSGLALADEISANGDKAAQRYINNMLKAGSSAPPLDILRNAGVDLETAAPIVSAMDAFANTVAEFDKLWTKKYGKM